MKILQFFYMFSSFILASSVTDFRQQISPDSYVFNNLMQILTSCKNNHEKITIFMNTAFSIHLKWLSNIYTHSPIPVRLHDVSDFVKHKQLFTISKTEAVVYIMSLQELDLEFLIYFMKNDVINRSVAFFIVNPSSNGCKLVGPVLMLVSMVFFRSAYFLCLDNNNKTQIYTYNNLTYRIPDKWKLIKEEHYKGNSLRIYGRFYEEEEICKNLYFDRTKFLDRYNVTIGVHMKEKIPIGNYYNYTTIRSNYRNFLEYWTFIMIDPLANFLNKSMILLNLPPTKNTTLGYLNELIERHKPELIVSETRMHNTYLNTAHYTYPIAWSERKIITYNWGYQSPIEKICNFYGIWTLLFTLFVLTLVFIVIWHSEGKRPAFILFEIIRLLIGQGLYTRMHSLPMRCFFGIILIYFLVIQATFNGNLAKFLTKPELKKHVESWEDLQNVDPNTIFYPEDVLSRKANRVLINSTYNCANYILHNDSSAVCLSDHYTALKVVWNNKNLHLSKKHIITEYFQDKSANVMPIHERIYKFYIWYVDLGFAPLLPRRLDFRIQLTISKSSKVQYYDGFDPLSVNHLTFGFVFLAIGLVIASICFCIEIVHAKKMLKPKNKPRNCKITKRFFLSKVLRNCKIKKRCYLLKLLRK